MELAGLTKSSFSRAFGVSADRVQEWLSGAVPVPPWVVPAIRIYELLPGSARQTVLRIPAARVGNRARNMHPFARIEDL
jgi:hypothetical protein